MKSKLLYKYIFSYLAVFLVPFLIMSTAIYLYAVSNLKHEIEQVNLNNLQQLESITNDRMKELETLAARISYDPRLTPYMISHSYYASEGIQELKKYKANSAIIDELFVYYYNQEKVYSTSGSYTLDSLMHNKYTFYNWDKAKLLKNLHTKIPMSIPITTQLVDSGDKSDVVSFYYPIAPNSPSPYGTVMYFIKKSTLTNYIDNILGEFGGNAYILNENNQLMASSIHDKNVDIKNVNLGSITDNKVQNIRIKGGKYTLLSVKSDRNGWRYITLIKENQFFKRLGDTSLLIILLLLIILIIGFVLAFLLAKNQYKPIQNLFESVNNGSQRHTKLEGENELDAIRNTISAVFEDHEKLNERIYKQRPFAREQLLTKLLKGDFKEDSEVHALLQALNIEMNDGEYFVAIANFDKEHLDKENIVERESLLSLFSNLSSDKMKAYGIDLLNQDAMALVVSIDPNIKEPKLQRKQLAQKMQNYIKDTTGIIPTIGVGRLYNEKSKINRSYIEALATIEHKFFYSQGSIIYIEELSTKREDQLGYPIEEEMKLVQSIKQGDKVVADETLDDIFKILASNDRSIHVIKAICFDVINTIVKTISEMGLETSIDKFNQIANFNTIEQLSGNLRELVLNSCEEIDNRKESHNNKLRNEILAYIQKNYNLYELSLERIAIEFQLSVSYISRFIKEQTGTTFTNYVQQLRMDEVKRQLKNTKKPIKEIVFDVGYKDVANFTRKFRKEIGVTPGQYRVLSQ